MAAGLLWIGGQPATQVEHDNASVYLADGHAVPTVIRAGLHTPSPTRPRRIGLDAELPGVLVFTFHHTMAVGDPVFAAAPPHGQ